MPFTFAHPAIVLPFQRLPKRYSSLSGLIAGSIAPDFEYFIRLEIRSLHSHTLSGLFYFNLPLALLLCFLFHQYVRHSLILHLPSGLFQRFYPYLKSNWKYSFRKNFGALLFSVLLGACSHLLWDSFTHDGAFFVELFGLHNLNIGPLPFYKVLQHLSTLFGFLYIGWFVFKMPVWLIQRPKNKVLSYWLKVLIVTSITWVILAICLSSLTVGVMVVMLIDSVLLALIVVGLWNKKQGRSYKRIYLPCNILFW